jgi:hypothetical protein
VVLNLEQFSTPELMRMTFYTKLRNKNEGLPPRHKIERFKRPDSRDFPESFHGSNSAIEDLLGKIDLNSGRKYLLAFDIDGTLMDAFPNEMMFDIWREGKSPDAAIKVLTDINALDDPRLRSVCLTARCNEDFRLIPSFDDMPVYGNFGYLKTHNQVSAKDFHEDRTELMPELLENHMNHMNLVEILHHAGIQQNTDLVYDPNSFYLKLRDHNIHHKEKIIEVALSILNRHGNQWSHLESPDGRLIIFNNDEKPFDKAKGVRHLINREQVDNDTTLVIFGDTGTDLKAMQEAKRVLGEDRVINVAVGSKLAAEDAVDTVLRDHIDTRRFIGRLYKKLQTN